ncbi:hypothetical protein TcasGA2_TC011957 [Tribolium castaneum]|uniref:Uncharacterized protein n=1 Tax=Tribolium castaneum TaxID=7070 RepID=D6X309_TRICA|nr:hypothetical protein TcasGA2_TC011957 [Tribolium castaneum]
MQVMRLFSDYWAGKLNKISVFAHSFILIQPCDEISKLNYMILYSNKLPEEISGTTAKMSNNSNTLRDRNLKRLELSGKYMDIFENSFSWEAKDDDEIPKSARLLVKFKYVGTGPKNKGQNVYRTIIFVYNNFEVQNALGLYYTKSHRGRISDNGGMVEAQRSIGRLIAPPREVTERDNARRKYAKYFKIR